MPKHCSAKDRLIFLPRSFLSLIRSFCHPLLCQASSCWYLVSLACTLVIVSPSFHQAYMALHDIDAAVESFKKALTLEPNDG